MNDKKGQIAIFIIVAIVIVGIIIFLLYFRGGIVTPQTTELSPQIYLKSCIETDIKENIVTLSKQGGYLNPEGYLTYNDEKIKYLCYTSEDYKTCVVQQPLIKEHFESELNELIKPKAEQCLSNLKQEYQKRGYDVTSGAVSINAYFNPSKLIVSYSTPIIINKAGTSKSFSGFNVEMDSEMYGLLMTAVSIIDYESTYGDSETTLYLQYYPDLKIEKTRLSEGSKVYRLTNAVTGETFSFASRSLVWPVGYGVS